MTAAGKALGVKTEFLGPQAYDAAAQLTVLEGLIEKKPAGIMIFPADTASLNDTMKSALKANIPIICVNSLVMALSVQTIAERARLVVKRLSNC